MCPTFAFYQNFVLWQTTINITLIVLEVIYVSLKIYFQKHILNQEEEETIFLCHKQRVPLTKYLQDAGCDKTW